MDGVLVDSNSTGIDNDTKKLIFIACILNIFLQDTYTSITQYTFLIYALQKN